MFARILLLATLAAAPALAASKPVTLTQKLGRGRNVVVQISEAQPGKPTFLFLPGVNRGLLLEEPAAQELIKQGYGVVGFNFSVQPLSLNTLPSNEKAGFYDVDVTLETLAAEAEGVARTLAAQYKVKNLVPVSLSYTGAVSNKLKAFPAVVDAVPLTSMAAFSPELAMYRNWLKAGEFWNPIYGPGITRMSLDAAYRMQWTKQVEGMTQQFGLDRARAGEMVDGYIRLSRATEGFEWSNKADRVRRTFIFAANENPALLRTQIEAARERLVAKSGESIFLVNESGHIVPAEQPRAYAKILELVAEGKNAPGVTLVTPSTGEFKTLSAEESLRLLDKALKELPSSPTGTRSTAPDSDRFPGTL